MHHHPRVILAPLLAGLLLAGCADDPPDADDSVVSLTVPDDWQRSDPEVTADVLESLRWTPPGEDGSSLQVIVGCGPDTTVDELVAGAATSRRAMPVVGTAGEPTELDVDGLDDARAVTFALGPSDDDVRMWMGGLYGVGGEGLVLVELMRPHASFSESLTEEVLASVEVDGDRLADHCDVDAA